MSSVKRKIPTTNLLERRVRPRYESEPESDFEDDASDSPSEEGVSASGSSDEDDRSEDESSANGSDEDSQDDQSDSESPSEEDDEESDTPQVDASKLSFGALAKAQAALGNAGKRKPASSDASGSGKESKDELPSKSEIKKPPKRSSKHAPVEMSSKIPVSRKRDFLTVTPELKKREPRDPRFMPLGGPGASSKPSKATLTVEEIKARKNYAFLDEYRESEMRQIREAIAKTKDPEAKEKLQKALMSMESRKKAQERKDRERAVLEEHRKRERELVRKGKTPYFLKRSERKKLALMEQFKSMKKKDVEKAIERRRKKLAAKEKKLLPRERRTAEDR